MFIFLQLFQVNFITIQILFLLVVFEKYIFLQHLAVHSVFHLIIAIFFPEIILFICLLNSGPSPFSMQYRTIALSKQTHSLTMSNMSLMQVDRGLYEFELFCPNPKSTLNIFYKPIPAILQIFFSMCQ